MSKRVLQVNYKIAESDEDLTDLMLQRAEKIASTVAGLEWKICLMNEMENELAGVYLFTDEASLDNYVNGPLVNALKSNPAVSDITMKKFTNMEAMTRITRGPI